MGIGWMMEMGSHFLNDKKNKIVIVSDIFNAGQGPVIFALTICRPSVRKYILKRFVRFFFFNIRAIGHSVFGKIGFYYFGFHFPLDHVPDCVLCSGVQIIRKHKIHHMIRQ